MKQRKRGLIFLGSVFAASLIPAVAAAVPAVPHGAAPVVEKEVPAPAEKESEKKAPANFYVSHEEATEIFGEDFGIARDDKDRAHLAGTTFADCLKFFEVRQKRVSIAPEPFKINEFAEARVGFAVGFAVYDSQGKGRKCAADHGGACGDDGKCVALKSPTIDLKSFTQNASAKLVYFDHKPGSTDENKAYIPVDAGQGVYFAKKDLDAAHLIVQEKNESAKAQEDIARVNDCLDSNEDIDRKAIPTLAALKRMHLNDPSIVRSLEAKIKDAQKDNLEAEFTALEDEAQGVMDGDESKSKDYMEISRKTMSWAKDHKDDGDKDFTNRAANVVSRLAEKLASSNEKNGIKEATKLIKEASKLPGLSAENKVRMKNYLDVDLPSLEMRAAFRKGNANKFYKLREKTLEKIEKRYAQLKCNDEEYLDKHEDREEVCQNLAISEQSVMQSQQLFAAQMQEEQQCKQARYAALQAPLAGAAAIPGTSLAAAGGFGQPNMAGGAGGAAAWPGFAPAGPAAATPGVQRSAPMIPQMNLMAPSSLGSLGGAPQVNQFGQVFTY